MERPKRANRLRDTLRAPWMIALFAVAIIGIASAAINEWRGWPTWLTVLESTLGSSALVAAVLALTVQHAFNQSLAERILRAAIGAPLYPALRDSLNFIFDQRAVCIAHHQCVTFLPTSEDRVICVRIRIERTFRNITSETYELPVSADTREYFRNNLSSRILDIGWVKAGHREDKWTASYETNEWSVKPNTTVSLAPDQECTVWYEWEEPRHDTDVAYIILGAPTINPTVSIEVDSSLSSSLDWDVSFAGQSQEKRWSLGKKSIQWWGTLYPQHHIAIAWWRRDLVDAWQNERIETDKKQPSTTS